MEGWIRLYRKTQEHWLWTKKRKFSQFEAWIYILFKANHKKVKIMLDGELIVVNKGSFITSEVQLAKEWTWDRSTVRKFLSTLEKDKMILKNATSKYTSISIENWELYQNTQQQEQHQDNINATSEQHQNNTNNNVNNVNNEKNVNNNIPASKDKSSTASAKASKHKYGEYQNVLLKDKELQELKEEYQNWEELIKYLDEYIEMKGYKAKSHYLCIKKWVVDAVQKQAKYNSTNVLEEIRKELN